MKAGRELDALIAEKVIGTPSKDIQEWTECYNHNSWYIQRFDLLPRYSTDMTAAWEVVDTLFKDGWRLELLGSEVLGDDMGGYDVYFSCKAGVRGDTAPHAICLAALKAVGVDVK